MNPTGAGPECEAILIVAGQDGDDGARIAATLLDSLLNVPDRERESIASTLGRIMNIYTSTAALRSGVNPNFSMCTSLFAAATRCTSPPRWTGNATTPR